MKGPVVTISVGQKYYDMSVLLALSAKEYGIPSVLLKYVDDTMSEHDDVFTHVIPLRAIGHQSTVRSPCWYWEFKKHMFDLTRDLPYTEFAYCDADSVVFRDLAGMSIPDDVHTPGVLRKSETWCMPPKLRIDAMPWEPKPAYVLNGGFLYWKNNKGAESWFRCFQDSFLRLREWYRNSTLYSDPRDELAMSMAFAAQGIELYPSDSSIGIWDAHNVRMSMTPRFFRCKKGYYWAGLEFEPYVLHFGGRNIRNKIWADFYTELSKRHGITLPSFETERK